MNSDEKRWSLHNYFMDSAEIIAQHGTCGRAKVGAIIERGGCVLGTGYNTSAVGLPTCKDEGHLMIDGHCCRTVHAEHNAILAALIQYGTLIEGSTMYVTHEPCVHCRKVIVQLGIRRVIYKHKYRSVPEAEQVNGNVEWIHYDTLQENL